MKAFLAACVAIVVLSVVSYYGLHETRWANAGEWQSATSSVRLD